MNKTTTPNDVVIVIPARMASSRLPGKPLAKAGNHALLRWAVDAARACKQASIYFVATDSPDIRQWCEMKSVPCWYEDPATGYTCGSERVAHAIEGQWKHHHPKLVVNLQCDEPDITGEDLDTLILFAGRHRHAMCSTLSCPWEDGTRGPDAKGTGDWPDVVKVVTDLQSRAMYFGRGEIPGDVHVGVYCFRIPALMTYRNCAPTPLEKAESLEQLRMLEHGVPIHVYHLDTPKRSIDNPVDLQEFNLAFLDRQ